MPRIGLPKRSFQRSPIESETRVVKHHLETARVGHLRTIGGLVSVEQGDRRPTALDRSEIGRGGQSTAKPGQQFAIGGCGGGSLNRFAGLKGFPDPTAVQYPQGYGGRRVERIDLERVDAAPSDREDPLVANDQDRHPGKEFGCEVENDGENFSTRGCFLQLSRCVSQIPNTRSF